MKTQIRFLGRAASLTAIALLIGCGNTSTSVRYDMAKGFQAGKYKQYHMIKHPVAKRADLDAVFEVAVRRALGNKGYQNVEKSRASAYVSVKLLLGNDPAPQTPPLTARFDAAEQGINAMNNRDKTLLVLLQDAQTHQVVWAGWSQMQVKGGEINKIATRKVSEILNRVPRIN